MMKYFKTEKQIARWSLLISCLSLAFAGYAIHDSSKSYDFSQKSFCFEKMSTRVEEINLSLYDLPTLISKCSIELLSCAEARLKIVKTKNLSFQAGALMSETSPYREQIDKLTTLLTVAETELKNTDTDRDFIDIAQKISSLRPEIAKINVKKLACTEF